MMLRSIKKICRKKKKFTPSYVAFKNGPNLTEGEINKNIGSLNYTPGGLESKNQNLEKDQLSQEKSEKMNEIEKIDKKPSEKGNKKTKYYENVLVQRFIDRPFLYNGHIADLRSFIVVLSAEPYIVLFHKGYIRRGSEPFIYEGEKSKRSYMTNFFMQKKHPNFEEIKETLIVPPKNFEKYVLEENLETFKNSGFNSTQDFEELIWAPVKEKIKDCMLAVQEKVDKKKGLFEILGCDFMFDEDLKKSYLIEINSNPAIWTSTNILNEVIRHVVLKTLDNVLRIHDLQSKGETVELEKLDLEGFEVLIFDKEN